MSFILSQKSLDKLKGVDEDLVRVVKRAIELTPIDFKVLEGIRTLERQKEIVEAGFSQTMKSKHLIGRAVDLGALQDGKITWDKQPYVDISKAVKQAANELNISIRWGGDFKSFFDGPHYELI